MNLKLQFLYKNPNSLPLYFAAQEGHETVTKHLLAARCNVNLQDKLGFTGSLDA